MPGAAAAPVDTNALMHALEIMAIIKVFTPSTLPKSRKLEKQEIVLGLAAVRASGGRAVYARRASPRPAHRVVWAGRGPSSIA